MEKFTGENKENKNKANTLIWTVEDIVLERLKEKVNQGLPRNEILITTDLISTSDNSDIVEEIPAIEAFESLVFQLIINDVANEVARRLIRDEIMDPNESNEGEYMITQDYYDYLKMKKCNNESCGEIGL